MWLQGFPHPLQSELFHVHALFPSCILIDETEAEVGVCMCMHAGTHTHVMFVGVRGQAGSGWQWAWNLIGKVSPSPHLSIKWGLIVLDHKFERWSELTQVKCP